MDDDARLLRANRGAAFAADRLGGGAASELDFLAAKHDQDAAPPPPGAALEA